jgi:hypothetical protein
MVRKLFGALAVALLLCFSAVLADEIKGKITKVDPDKHTITVSVDDKETTYTVAEDADLGTQGKDKTPRTLKSLAAQLEKAKDAGKDVKGTITTKTVKGKEVVVKYEPARGKGGKKGGDK